LQGEPNGLRADSAAHIQHSFGFGPLGLYQCTELLALPADARIPVLVDQVIQGCEFVVKVGHRDFKLGAVGVDLGLAVPKMLAVLRDDVTILSNGVTSGWKESAELGWTRASLKSGTKPSLAR
jgi:hypothetical protein